MNERLKDLRKELNLNQNEFGKRINLKQSAIGMYENGSRKLTERVISDICREFNVNEQWLHEGIGEMFNHDVNDEIEKLAKKYRLNDYAKTVVETFVKLDEKDMNAVLSFMKKVNMDFKSNYNENE